MDMKLNKYIYIKLKEGNEDYMGYEATEEDIEDWIVDWYNDTFKELKEGAKEVPRGPPMWLAGARWYDRRDRKIKEAKEAEEAELKEAEARSYDKDE